MTPLLQTGSGATCETCLGLNMTFSEPRENPVGIACALDAE